MNKIVDDILLAQPVASRDGVVKMVLKAIVILGNGCGPPFCSDRMAAHRIDFRNQGDFSVGVGLSGGDSGTKACPAGANYGEIGEKFARHSSSFSVFRRRAGEKVSLLLYRYRSIALGSVWKIDVFDFFIDMCGYLSVVFMRQG